MVLHEKMVKGAKILTRKKMLQGYETVIFPRLRVFLVGQRLEIDLSVPLVVELEGNTIFLMNTRRYSLFL